MNKKNTKGQKHGPWEQYHSNGKLDYKGLFVNNLEHGLWESHWVNGQFHYKANWFMGEQIGFWEIFSNSGKSWGKQFYL